MLKDYIIGYNIHSLTMIKHTSTLSGMLLIKYLNIYNKIGSIRNMFI
jgi:hypothetical protein